MHDATHFYFLVGVRVKGQLPGQHLHFSGCHDPEHWGLGILMSHQSYRDIPQGKSC